jgi:hypothetical protein
LPRHGVEFVFRRDHGQVDFAAGWIDHDVFDSADIFAGAAFDLRTDKLGAAQALLLTGMPAGAPGGAKAGIGRLTGLTGRAGGAGLA